jgi:hypothetical protein
MQELGAFGPCLKGQFGSERVDQSQSGLVPGAARVAVLVNPANAAVAESRLTDLESAARTIGLQIQVLNASTSREIDAAFATLVRERPDALFVSADPFSRADGCNLPPWRRAKFTLRLPGGAASH